MVSQRQSLTTMSFPAFSGRFATFNAAAAVAPEDIPTCKIISLDHKLICFIVYTPEKIALTERTNNPSLRARSLAVSIASSPVT